VKIKQASLNNAMVNLNYCKIVRPWMAWSFRARWNWARRSPPASTPRPFFQIANDLTKMQIDSSVAEADVGGILERQTVDLPWDAYPDRTFHGVVSQVRNSPRRP